MVENIKEARLIGPTEYIYNRPRKVPETCRHRSGSLLVTCKRAADAFDGSAIVGPSKAINGVLSFLISRQCKLDSPKNFMPPRLSARGPPAARNIAHDQ